MISLLFSNYKEKIYKKRYGKLKKIEIILIVLLIISGGSLILSLTINHKLLELVSSIALFTTFVIIIVYTNKRDKIRLESYIEFKKDLLDDLTKMLDKDFDLLSAAGLNLIIKNCNDEIESINRNIDRFSLKNYVTTVIYPIVIVSLGSILSKTSFKLTIELSAVIIYGILWLTYIWMVCMSLYKLFISDINVYKSLKSDIEILLVKI